MIFRVLQSVEVDELSSRKRDAGVETLYSELMHV
jgi:hypothetical protein